MARSIDGEIRRRQLTGPPCCDACAIYGVRTAHERFAFALRRECHGEAGGWPASPEQVDNLQTLGAQSCWRRPASRSRSHP